jgi:SAM-dependent methyltransferase
MSDAATTDWDTYWQWEWFKGGLAEGKFRDYFTPSAEHLDHLLRQAGARKVLDASCGPGCKSVLLYERGHEVTASDASQVAVDIAGEIATEEGADIAIHRHAWDALPGEWDGSFDAVINDALAWVPTKDALHAAMRSFCRVLKPGGVLLFSGASELEPTRTAAELIEANWHGPNPRLAGRWQRHEVSMIELAVDERLDDAIVCHHLYVVEESGQVRLETARYVTLYRWSWKDYQAAAAQGGFASLRSERLELAGRTKIHNVATK